MIQIALYEPEIPPNTGNIIRLCANTGTSLHLVEPLGFNLDDRRLRRAGLDYREFVDVKTYDSLEALLATVPHNELYAISTKGQQCYSQVDYRDDDLLLFGPETRGLPEEVLSSLQAKQVLRIPMISDSRSLNLSNAVAIVLYEAWRQAGFNQPALNRAKSG